MLRLLKPADYRVMPWKNGGGTTTEIWIDPPGAGWDAFEWRVGIADIAQSGPFSSFPGIDRSIMLLECPEGSGMRLTIDGRDVHLPLHEFVDFTGEATTFGTLAGAPVRDFNVMSRRTRTHHRRGSAMLSAATTHRLPQEGALFIHAIEGDATISQDRHRRGILAGESLLADGGGALHVASRATAFRFVWAAFQPTT